MKQYASNNDGDCRSSCGAFRHEAQIGQQEADLKAEYACDVAE